MRLVFTGAAESDLETIGDYIALSNPHRAVSFVREIRARCMDLRETPQACPLLERHEAAGIRKRVHGNYLIFYRVHDRSVGILRVLHGAMDYERLLFSEDE